MKLQIAILLLIAFPLTSHAERLIYPDTKIKLVKTNSIQESLPEIFAQLNLGLSPEQFKLKETKISLLGKHYYLQQTVNGIDVNGSQVVVSINRRNEIIKVYNSVTNSNFKSLPDAIPLISESMAYEIAWKRLNVNGELTSTPVAKLVYDNEMNLIYKINLSTSSPFGHFEIDIDSQTGAVKKVTDSTLPRMKRKESVPARSNQKAAHSTFSAAFAKFDKTNFKSFMKTELAAVNGTAQIFDPNPVVSLGLTNLTDETSASIFLPAYRTETLNDISLNNGVYTLTGPKVTIIDFESPTVAPSTSSDGSWIFERKDVRFNDAMTYLHIDRSIRYIESLGFVKTKAIFTKSLEIDANGVDGADNSYYVPSSRRLAFGHGCVDDNEDADVILHELGHAIQHHINTSWTGGDTGAMGEGFGDYWAASYSVTTEHGREGNVHWVFKWDGHNSCWPGRKLDTFTPVYSSMSTYPAHSRVNGGISDELWSTPLFQSFLELYDSGVARSDIDKIVLEAHFGLGSGIKMPEMAKAIVKTAKALFPSKNYDKVYSRHFQKQGILAQ